MKIPSRLHAPRRAVSAFRRWLVIPLLLAGVGLVHGQFSTLAPKPLTSIENIADLIPSSLILRTGSSYNAVAVKQAEDALILHANSEPAVLRCKVEALEPTKNYGFDYVITAPITPLVVRGAPCNYRLWTYFKGDKADALAKVRVGSTVVALGTLNRVNIVMDNGKPLLRLDLDDASLYPSMEAATAALAARSRTDSAATPPTQANPPISGPAKSSAPGSSYFGADQATVASKAELVGTWELDTAQPGSQHYTMEVHSDGTWAWDRSFTGTWTVENGLFKMRFDGPGYVDVYKLPVRNGELRGINGVGGQLYMKRKASGTTGASH